MFYRAKPLCDSASLRLCVRYLEAARRRFPQSNGLSTPFYMLYMFYTAKPLQLQSGGLDAVERPRHIRRARNRQRRGAVSVGRDAYLLPRQKRRGVRGERKLIRSADSQKLRRHVSNPVARLGGDNKRHLVFRRRDRFDAKSRRACNPLRCIRGRAVHDHYAVEHAVGDEKHVVIFVVDILAREVEIDLSLCLYQMDSPNRSSTALSGHSTDLCQCRCSLPQ